VNEPDVDAVQLSLLDGAKLSIVPADGDVIVLVPFPVL
jgi:hypothetical protein